MALATYGVLALPRLSPAWLSRGNGQELRYVRLSKEHGDASCEAAQTDQGDLLAAYAKKHSEWSDMRVTEIIENVPPAWSVCVNDGDPRRASGQC